MYKVRLSIIFLFLNENILFFYSIRVHKENQGLQDFLVLMGLL